MGINECRVGNWGGRGNFPLGLWDFEKGCLPIVLLQSLLEAKNMAESNDLRKTRRAYDDEGMSHT